jgi:chromosome segregation ATPase
MVMDAKRNQELPGARSEANHECEVCFEQGEIYTHTDDCRSDWCALAGGMDDCVGQLVECPSCLEKRAQNVTEHQQEKQKIIMLAGKCGHHFEHSCNSCNSALNVTNQEIHRLHSALNAERARANAAEKREEELQKRLRKAKLSWSESNERIAASLAALTAQLEDAGLIDKT